MAEKEEIFSSKIKYNGFYSFSNFYKFCYDWLREEFELIVTETKYTEKLKGDSKEIEIEWKCFKKVTDYFKFEVKVTFRILGMTEVEINQGGAKVKTNKGSVEVKTTGELVRDYDSKFEKTAFRKFTRAIYEKWVIYARIKEFEDKLADKCDEFLNQAKAYLDLEGKR